MMQVYRARRLHTVFFIHDDFGWHAADRGCDGRNRDSRQVSNGAATSEHDHRPLLIGRSKAIKADIATGYSAGRAASASQRRDSSGGCGCLE
jgi:hypothetical protein